MHECVCKSMCVCVCIIYSIHCLCFFWLNQPSPRFLTLYRYLSKDFNFSVGIYIKAYINNPKLSKHSEQDSVFSICYMKFENLTNINTFLKYPVPGKRKINKLEIWIIWAMTAWGKTYLLTFGEFIYLWKRWKKFN